MSGSQQSGKLSCELKRPLSRLERILVDESAVFAEARDKTRAGMSEKTLSETVFLIAALLEGRFPSGLFCSCELSLRARNVGWRNWW